MYGSMIEYLKYLRILSLTDLFELDTSKLPKVRFERENKYRIYDFLLIPSNITKQHNFTPWLWNMSDLDINLSVTQGQIWYGTGSPFELPI